MKFDGISPEYLEIIRSANTPNKAFILGGQKKKYGFATKWTINPNDKRTLNEVIDAFPIKIRADWDKVKLDIMRKALKAKFEAHLFLRKMLIETGDAILVEDSARDNFWGIGKDGKGNNYLGLLLMEYREK